MLGDDVRLPSVYQDQHFVQTAESYAHRMMRCITLANIENALKDAYLDGANNGLRIGYQLSERHHERNNKPTNNHK